MFSITGITTRSGRNAASPQLTLRVPGAGKLTAVATSSYKVKKRGGTKKTIKVTLGRASGAATAAGSVKMMIKVGAAGRGVLRKARRLQISVKVTYTPSGGTASIRTKTATLRAPKRK